MYGKMGTEMAPKSPRKTPAGEGAPAGSTREAGEAFSKTPQSSQAPASSQGLTMVNKLSELRPGTYWTKRLDQPKGWIVVVSRFADGNVKIRVSTMSPQGLIQILNINLGRVNDLIAILNKVIERLPEDAKKPKETREEGEW
jgi:hypothetical protein